MLTYLNNLLKDNNEIIKLTNSQNIACDTQAKKYFQQAVLINKSDVLEFITDTTSHSHNIKFKLKNHKKGFKFISLDKGDVFYGSFTKTTTDNQLQYMQSIQLPITGISQESKSILKQLDHATYFAALQLMDSTIEIYGFTYGLTTEDYQYDIQNNNAGCILTLKSHENLLEDEVPYI